MSYIPMESLLEKVDNRYLLVLLASKRTMQLTNGAPSLVDGFSPKTKTSTVALEEIFQGKVSLKNTGSK